MSTRSAISRIFYIYSNASVAVLMGVCALVELICGIALQFAFNNPVYVLCYVATACFTAITVGMTAGIYKDAKRSGLI